MSRLDMDARDRFAALLERDDASLDLGRAALLVALTEYPDLEVEAYLGRFDQMAADLRPRIGAEHDARRIAAILANYLFDELGFAGNAADYYDPRNSYLNDVLDRRLGIPITLSLLYLELGKRLGLPLEGVGLPGHFVVYYADPSAPILIDPFERGALLDEAACRDRLRALHGHAIDLTPGMLRPVGARAILFRMLNNLKGAYGRREQYGRAARMVDLMLLVEPGAVTEYRERGFLRFRAADFKSARRDLEHYLELAPDARDADQVREQLSLIERLEAMRN